MMILSKLKQGIAEYVTVIIESRTQKENVIKTRTNQGPLKGGTRVGVASWGARP